MNTSIIYEQPLNELIRVGLRQEHLFIQIDHCLANFSNSQDSRTLVKLIIDLMNLLDRPDLKSKLNQEFNRIITILHRLQNVPNISRNTLMSTLDKLKKLRSGYLTSRGKVGESLRSNDFLITLRQNLLTPAGDGPINAPHYYYWLNQPIEFQLNLLKSWLKEFEEIRQAIDLLLEVARQASEPTSMIAKKGFYYQSLDPVAPLQLIRVSLSQDLAFYPEMSLGKHRISVRMMIPDLNNRPKQTTEDIPFELTCCTI